MTQTFFDLGVCPELVDALDAQGITTPFPIQTAALPDALAGRDVLGRGRTGSGKTIAFVLPIVQRLAASGSRQRFGKPRALILVPTRELAVQVHEVVKSLGKPLGLTSLTVFGGVSQVPQVRKLAQGVDVCVATPGRLEDLIEQGHLDLSQVRITVVDEADLMSDMGFLPPVTRIMEQVPSDGQRMLFSATLDNDVDTLVRQFLHDPVDYHVDDDQPTPTMDQRIFMVNRDNKMEVLRDLVRGEGKTLAFTRTRLDAERLVHYLKAAGIEALDIHGNLSQAVRQRHLDAFSQGRARVLVATDIAARGIHVDDIALVVHVDPPQDPKAFLHRSGRTARAGQKGIVVTLCTRDQNRKVRAMLKAARISAASKIVAPGDAIIEQIRGPIAEPLPKISWDAPSKPRGTSRSKALTSRGPVRHPATAAGAAINDRRDDQAEAEQRPEPQRETRRGQGPRDRQEDRPVRSTGQTRVDRRGRDDDRPASGRARRPAEPQGDRRRATGEPTKEVRRTERGDRPDNPWGRPPARQGAKRGQKTRTHVEVTTHGQRPAKKGKRSAKAATQPWKRR